MSNKFLHFALRTEDGYLAKDTRNNQLEIYEERKDAEKVKQFCSVVGVYVFSEKEYKTLIEERDKLQNQIRELESFIIDISNTIDKFFHGLQRSDYVLHELEALLSKHTTHKGGNNE